MDNMLGSSRRSVLAAGLAVSATWLLGRSQAQTFEHIASQWQPRSDENGALNFGEQQPMV